MGLRIFLAGGAGVVGRRLVPLLSTAGHRVFGTTRSQARASALRALGAEPVIVDVFDAEALSRAVVAAEPAVVIHQLTDLPGGLDPSRMREALPRNARLRDEGTRNLVQAALVAGARRMVAQSIGWAYAPGPLPHAESDPLDLEAGGDRAVSVRGVVALENHVLRSPPLIGTVLRYGQLYGPGTGRKAPSGAAPLHVDAAAHAASLAIDRDTAGIFNVAEPNGEIAAERAVTELGWRADFRLDAPEANGRDRDRL